MRYAKFSESDEGGWGRYTYEKYFYHRLERGKHIGAIKGFPMQRKPWCQQLKVGYGATTKSYIRKVFLQGDREQQEEQGENMGLSVSSTAVVQFNSENATAKFSKGSESEVVQYLGIAADEPIRIERHKDKNGILLPLVEIGWTEADAKQWCMDNDLLSPIYTDKCNRGGCWFCHNQGVDQLRQLRHNYPDLWQLLLKWDKDSPVTFHADGHTVHDFDVRFQWEDEGYMPTEKNFRWKDVYESQMNIYQFMEGGFYERQIN